MMIINTALGKGDKNYFLQCILCCTLHVLFAQHQKWYSKMPKEYVVIFYQICHMTYVTTCEQQKHDTVDTKYKEGNQEEDAANKNMSLLDA